MIINGLADQLGVSNSSFHTFQEKGSLPLNAVHHWQRWMIRSVCDHKDWVVFHEKVLRVDLHAFETAFMVDLVCDAHLFLVSRSENLTLDPFVSRPAEDQSLFALRVLHSPCLNSRISGCQPRHLSVSA